MRGKVSFSSGEKLERWDHPRLCGEKVNVPIFPVFVQGSPPPMRGKVQPVQDHKSQKRITPAYAGKSKAN